MAKLTRFGQWLAAGLVCCTAALSSAATGDPKPNIILLISDDHRWDGLGIAGNDNVKTPNLDQMASEGQWFREATIQMPLCAPSRAVLLTGQPPSVNGYYANSTQRKDLMRPDGFDQHELMPEHLQQLGYHTVYTGKWHLRADPWLCGFETIKHWMLGGMGAYKNPRLANGNTRETENVEGFTQTIFANDAIEALKAKADGDTTRPLFLWVAFTAPHLPFVPNPEPISGMYDGKTAKDLAPETFHDDPSRAKGGDKSWQHYYEAITAVDAEVGRIMDTVRNSSLSTNTLVVFIGDNGFMMGSRGVWGKGNPYEGSLRVPMIVWGPDGIVKAKGTTVTASANSIDLPPTFVKLAGGTPPDKWAGRDLTPVFQDGKPHDITWAVSQNPNPGSKESAAYRVIRTPEHKLIHWAPESKNQPELYDLVKDPGEKSNLYGKPEVAEVQARLEKQLQDFRTKSGDTHWELQGETETLKNFRDDDSDGERAKDDGKRKGRKNRGDARRAKAKQQ